MSVRPVPMFGGHRGHLGQCPSRPVVSGVRSVAAYDLIAPADIISAQQIAAFGRRSRAVNQFTPGEVRFGADRTLTQLDVALETPCIC